MRSRVPGKSADPSGAWARSDNATVEATSNAEAGARRCEGTSCACECTRDRGGVNPLADPPVIVESPAVTSTPWIQIYDPLANPWLSTAAAALPIVLLLVALGVLEWRAHLAALTGLAAALAVSVFIYGMPARLAAATAGYGAAYGLPPVRWVLLHAAFFYHLAAVHRP